MPLSSDLIMEFVKMTNSKKGPKPGSTAYGTVRINGELISVKLDGSDQPTPAITTADVTDGERVTVLMKDHRAIITGNIDAPAARNKEVDGLSDDLVSFKNFSAENFEATNAQIEALDVKIFKSKYANIEELIAESATIVDLRAEKASVEDFTALEAYVDALQADKANVSDLVAMNGAIYSLESDTANIKTLIFGSATGDVIHASFSNSVIAQLGDAQIKSAMIDSVSASKITTGDIITNNVRVKSEDGKLLISDETLQISDTNRVRVQIGKDAANDYSINIWDQNGNLMFSKGGITDSAIKDAIIRNDMVSDTANIAAHKLDIDSLFDEINESTKTIKSSRVYLDEQGQTLDVSFKTLSTNLSTLYQTVASQGTSISVIQGQITSKIWQQDIDTAKNEMSTEYSALEQNLSSFTTTVSETYATVSSLTDVSNRTIHKSGTIDLTSDEYDTDTYYPVVGSIMPFDGYRHVAVNVQLNSSSKPSWSTHDGGFTCNASVRMKAGGWGTVDANTLGWIDDFTYNFCDKMPAYIHQNRNASKPVVYLRGGGRYFLFTDYESEWTVYTEDYTQSNTTFSPTANPTNSPNLVDNWKTVSRVTSAETKIEQLSDRITATVTETTNLGTRTSTLEQTAEGLTLELDALTIGGRNYIRSSAVMVPGNSSTGITVTAENGGVKVVAESGNGNWHSWYQPCVADTYLKDGDPFTFSVEIKGESGASGLPKIYIKSGMGYYPMTGTLGTDYNRVYYTGVWNSTNPVQFHFGWNEAKGTYYIRRPKLEKGTRFTDWTPAPEDIDDGVSSASKTATNYMNASTAGLVIGDMTASTLGNNVLIDSDSVDIRNGTTTLASFGADYLYLARNSRNATIDLCNGLAKMYHQSRLSYDTLFVIETPNATEIRGTADPLCVTSTVASKPAIKFANSDGVLGSIGMVASASGAMITRNVPSTAATYTILDTGNFYTMMDSGWINCALGDGFSRYSNNIPQPQVRKIGKQVYFRGEAKPSTAITPGTDTPMTLATIPSGYRPGYRKQFVMQGSGSYRWLLIINTDGTATISRYSNSTTTNMEVAAGAWLCCHAQWLTD